VSWKARNSSGPAALKPCGPKEFQFDGEEVSIRRHGNAVILEPIVNDGAWLTARTTLVDADFEHAANKEPAPQNRPDVDFFA